ncbi:Pyridinium-3,5-biscarboxylic acid mononucleotide sulfurtransferase [Neomoorella glycerini]|uniref:Pyridinium-3,5-biscarboxylic acid mononucleotide sulfurtransferase n=1 Tax=Neomoorella glycerini TaxID=55779 RepID=A0A6I5ZQ33_9FIRM|nr:ATP-dependent sacrificial sulfur transferase LarE [Moorella glycerini]QGP91918.1 Pyridinium-3,5-biscarboxylic acid mononucleotide sulfurtransferase [Moorella glycerini]
MITADLAAKLEHLQNNLAGMEAILVAYSGGVDSSLLLKVASMTPARVLAVTAASPTYPQVEIEAATRLARELGISHMVINTKEMANPAFTANPPERCYHCKKELFATLQELAREHGLKVIVDGANADDSSDFRPGSRAAREFGVRSPLQEAGLTKEEIRRLARYLSLPNWDKPSMACLSSRIPYGQAITPEKLEQVAAAEAFLRQLGLREIRVRHHGAVARLEVNPSAFALLIDTSVREKLVNCLHELGFTYITLDLEGFRSGSMNAVLSPVERVVRHNA